MINLVGFVAFTASAVLEALRVVLVEVLMAQLRYNEAEVLLYQVSAPAPLPQLPHNLQCPQSAK